MKFSTRLTRIDNSLTVVADLIERFGNEGYLPVFQRLEEMRQLEAEKDDVLGRVRRLAAARKSA